MGDSKAKAQRRREFPPLPEPLPIPAVDNHTHLDSVLEMAVAIESEASNSGQLSSERGTPQAHRERQSKPLYASANRQLELAAAVGIDRIVQVGCELPSAHWTDQWLRELEAGGFDDRGSSKPLRGRPDEAAAAGRLSSERGTPQADRERLSKPPAALVVGAIAIHPNEAVRHAGVYEVAADGLEPVDHPHHATSLADAIAEIAALAAGNPRIRAIGETGMDLFRAGPQGAEVQRRAFREHIALAKELDLALQIHDREAHAQVIQTLLHDGAPARTVFHCFSGDAEMANVAAEQGWYLSFAGPITYRANEALRQAVQAAPLHLILAETDAPYLTPHPYRGQPNAPYVVNHTIRALAEIKQIPLADMCQIISENSERVYGPW